MNPKVCLRPPGGRGILESVLLGGLLVSHGAETETLSSRYGGSGLLHRLLDRLCSNWFKESWMLLTGKQLYLNRHNIKLRVA